MQGLAYVLTVAAVLSVLAIGYMNNTIALTAKPIGLGEAQVEKIGPQAFLRGTSLNTADSTLSPTATVSSVTVSWFAKVSGTYQVSVTVEKVDGTTVSGGPVTETVSPNIIVGSRVNLSTFTQFDQVKKVDVLLVGPQ